jgi:hypothetical protein
VNKSIFWQQLSLDRMTSSTVISMKQNLIFAFLFLGILFQFRAFGKLTGSTIDWALGPRCNDGKPAGSLVEDRGRFQPEREF